MRSPLQRVAAGEAAAFSECLDRYGGLVWSLARRLSASEAEAEDGAQEAFIALWENAARFDAFAGDEATFVAMIARRRLIDQRRKHDARQRLVSNAPPAEPRPSGGTHQLIASDEAARIRRAMEHLAGEQRRVLTLAVHYGLTYEQIAGHTGLPLGTVKTHARRALLAVRTLLDAGQKIGAPT